MLTAAFPVFRVWLFENEVMKNIFLFLSTPGGIRVVDGARRRIRTMTFTLTDNALGAGMH